MNKIITFATLALASSPVFAVPTVITEVPIPGVLPLVGVGALAIFAIKYFRK